MSGLILYNLSHYSYLTYMIAHSINYFSNSRTILIIDTGWLSEETAYFLSTRSEIPGFTNYFFYNESEINKNDENIAENINSYFDAFFKKIGIDINSFDKIYSGFDTIHAFGVYLKINNVKHSLFDANMISSTDNSKGLFLRSKYHAVLEKYKALTWNTELVDEVIYTLGSNFEEIRNKLIKNDHPCKNRKFANNKKISFFSMPIIQSTLAATDFQKIINFYKISEIPTNSKVTILFLTSSFYLKTEYYKKYLQYMTKSEAYLLPYRVVLDALDLKNANLIVKAHPNTKIESSVFKKLFPDAIYIPGYVPSDLLDYFNLNPTCGITLGSNAISTMQLPHTYTLPREFFNDVEELPTLLFIESISKKVGYDHIIVPDINQNVLSAYQNTLLPNICKDEKDNSIIYLKKYEKPVNPDNHYIIGPIDEITKIKEKVDIQYYVISNNRTNQYGVLREKYVQFFILINIPDMSQFYYQKQGHYTFCNYYGHTLSEYEFLSIQDNNGMLLNTTRRNIIGDIKKAEELFNKQKKDPKLREMAISAYQSIVEDGRANSCIRTLLSLLWNSKNPPYDEIAEICNNNLDNPYSRRYLYWMNRDGKGTKKDVEKAIEYIKPTMYMNVDWALTDYFDALLLSKNDNYNTIRNLLLKFNKNVPAHLIRISRAYLNDNILGKNEKIAIEYAKKAFDLDSKYYYDYMNVLWNINTESSISSYINLATKKAEEGDIESIGLLGRSYYFGKGNAVNKEKGLNLIKNAAENDCKWAKILLKKINQGMFD